jgi:hypothetical protein
MSSLSTAHPDQNNALDMPNTALANVGNGAALCGRCQRFDIQTFTRSARRRRGYAVRDVETAAANGCEFCALLLDSVRDVEKPVYFGGIGWLGGLKPTIKPTNPDLYVHMTISENYRNEKEHAVSQGLRVNRLLVEIGDRFSDVRNASEHELYLTTDPG